MPTIAVSQSATVDAPPAKVYGLIADYHNGHPRIVPPRWFSDMRVERGGVGAGTLIRFKMTLMGSTREFRAEISEPAPGRVLQESYADMGMATKFIVEPLDEGRRCHVTIHTEWSARGLKGWVERLLAPRMLRRVYVEELQILARLATAE